MKKALSIAALLAVVSIAQAIETNWEFLSPVRNAQYVYVTSYSGSQFATTFGEDRRAISAVQDAFKKWGYTIVYQPQWANMIVVVERRPSVDILDVYDRQSWHQRRFLWRATAKGGLNVPDMPLMHQLQDALSRIKGKPQG